MCERRETAVSSQWKWKLSPSLKKCNSADQMWRLLKFSSAVEVWCIIVLFLDVKEWVKNSANFMVSTWNCVKRSELWWESDCFLHHDNAAVHIALPIQKFLLRNKTSLSPQPSSYSPNLSPAEFFLFWNWRLLLKWFESEENKKNARATNSCCFRTVCGIQGRRKCHWNHSVNAQWNCFEGDNV
jgi:hypothetical protein